jgi:hypothetical protein
LLISDVANVGPHRGDGNEILEARSFFRCAYDSMISHSTAIDASSSAARNRASSGEGLSTAGDPDRESSARRKTYVEPSNLHNLIDQIREALDDRDRTTDMCPICGSSLTSWMAVVM